MTNGAGQRWSAFFRALTWCALAFTVLFWVSVGRDEDPSALLAVAGGMASLAAFTGLVATRTKPRRWLALGLVLASAFNAAGIILPRLQSPGQRKPCNSNLCQIGKALLTYTAPNGDYFPFDERGPLQSLTLLYPAYLEKPNRFLSLDWEGNPLGSSGQIAFPAGTAPAGLPCDFGYTWRVSANPPADFAVMADMPRNHANGYHVLYADGRVKWQTTPFCSHDPTDNIFSREPGWSADTDTYIR